MPTDALPRTSNPVPGTPPRPGRFGDFGGSFVPEILHPVLEDLKAAWAEAQTDPEYQAEYRRLLKDYVGRPTPLTRLDRLTERLGGATVWAKREDLCHTGAHKINSAIGQVLLARRMSKARVIAETGAGQHGVATATACALFGVECVVYMGAEDIERQNLNVQRMRLLGATVRAATSGSQTLKDATNEAFRDWVSNPESTYYIIGSAIGPHPYPEMVRELHRVIGDETRRQLADATGRETPDAVVACVGGGSNAIGIWAPFIDDAGVRLVGVEAAGEGLEGPGGRPGRHAATLSRGEPAVFHGTRTMLLQDADGQVEIAHSVSAGLDYPGVGPQHAHLAATGRVEVRTASDVEAMEGVRLLSETEGIIPALETAHAVAVLPALAAEMGEGATLVFNCSGRGDKDMATISAWLDAPR